ncbi:hypothetical protein GCM10009105_05040 [Dokdonella soli]|uniref:N-acetyltransferase domain-containing protein n=2 Tax=Dokdonella soli TaxID=529810 RepID=A0ABN1ICJ8_9GAMM
MDVKVVRNEQASRFEAVVDGALSVLDYRLRDGVLAIDHVIVPDAVSGRGIAGALTKAALDLARHEHWRVIPNCAYAAAYIERYPDYRDLVSRA